MHIQPEKYLFVTGCFRSGTTLLARVLNLSDDIKIVAGETHYFGHLFTKGVKDLLLQFEPFDSDERIKGVIDFMYDLPDYSSRTNYGALWVYIRKNYSKQTLFEIFKHSERNLRGILLELLRVYGNGHIYIGEKTPSHVYHIPEILKWFPDAKIINILRDPRSIFLSEYKRKVKQRSGIVKLTYYLYQMIHVSISWNYICYLHFYYRKRYKGQ
jgi:omega-hydroxy-beta-dihydromenaquinone-9 sulfotransferase